MNQTNMYEMVPDQHTTSDAKSGNDTVSDV